MTREEAIEYAESKKMRLEALVYNDDCKYGNYAMYSGELSFVNAALSALRPVSREQIKKMKKEPVEGEYDELYAPTYKCPECGFENIGKGNFCQNCGCLYTDEAVDMVMERLEATYEQDND